MRIQIKYIYLSAFIIVAYILLPVMNADYLYTIQDNNVFISGHTFMMDVVDHQGGWGSWIACYLTQFFYHPWLGSTILIALWALIYLLTLQLFNIKDKYSPLALILPLLLLFNVLDYGYWIYYAKTPGFPFLPTLILLFCLLFALLLLPLLRRTQHGKWLNELLPVELCMLAGAITLIFIFPPQQINILNNHRPSFLTTLSDKNFKHEMRMYRALDEFRYDDVIKEMEAYEKEASASRKESEADIDFPTNLMVIYKNIALMQTGRLDRMFELNNCGTIPKQNNGPEIHISQLGSALIYYQFGQMNFAFRRAMESAVKYGLSFRNLKMMARTALMNREFDMAEKYLSMLKTSTFHREWAKEHERWLMSSTDFLQSIEYQTLAPLMHDDANTLDDDHGLCDRFLLQHFAELPQANTPLLEDVALCMSLWAKNDYAFCVHFYDYAHAHPEETIPHLYQEAAILLGTAENSPIEMNDFRFDPLVSDKFNRFVSTYNTLLQQGLSEKEMGKRMWEPFGSTFWWYYYFYTDFTLY